MSQLRRRTGCAFGAREVDFPCRRVEIKVSTTTSYIYIHTWRMSLYNVESTLSRVNIARRVLIETRLHDLLDPG